MYSISIVSSKVVQPPPPASASQEKPVEEEVSEIGSLSAHYEPVTEGPQPTIQELMAAMETMREEFTAQLSAKEQAVVQVREQLSIQIKNVSSNYDGLFSIVIVYILLQIWRMLF